MANTLAAHSFHTFTTRQRRSDGRELIIEVNASPIVHRGEAAILSLNRDITEQIEMRQSLLHAQKMEAMGRVAGGVAHDFNNLLTVIRGGMPSYCACARRSTRRRSTTWRWLEEAAEKAASLTAQLLAFSRRQRADPRRLDLVTELASASKMLRRLLPERVELTVTPAEDLPPVVLDPTQLQQVLINLAINSADAMPEGGRLEIRVNAVDRAGRRLVRLVVQDEGTGMEATSRRRPSNPSSPPNPKASVRGWGCRSCTASSPAPAARCASRRLRKRGRR